MREPEGRDRNRVSGSKPVVERAGVQRVGKVEPRTTRGRVGEGEVTEATEEWKGTQRLRVPSPRLPGVGEPDVPLQTEVVEHVDVVQEVRTIHGRVQDSDVGRDGPCVLHVYGRTRVCAIGPTQKEG